MHEEARSTPARPRWEPRSLALIVLTWLILQVGGLFSPGLLDDVDSVYIQIAREMLHRHDFVTPTIDGIRFFDKPPLMYWLAAGSMKLFGEHDWAARLPLALAVLALLLATYALGLHLFAWTWQTQIPQTQISQTHRDLHGDRAAFYATLALATSIGPYIYTRFYIPDIVIALWLTLAIHAFLLALERTPGQGLVPRDHPNEVDIRVGSTPSSPAGTRTSSVPSPLVPLRSSLLPCLAFAAVTGLNLLTKGLIGIVFPIAFVLLYLAFTRSLHLLRRFHLAAASAVFLAIAAPWHILAALRNPAIPLPPGLGLPASAGWAWFYLYNEHVARFLSRRIPHDYGQVPIPLFWLLAAIWLFPWIAFVPGAIVHHLRDLRRKQAFPLDRNSSTLPETYEAQRQPAMVAIRRNRQAALSLLLWTAIVLVFFTLSARQEYYSLPALPALALMAGGLLARADNPTTPSSREARRAALVWSGWLLVPLGTIAAFVAGYFAITAPHPDPHTDIATLLHQGADTYNLSLGHLFDLTGGAMGLFRGPLTLFALSMLAIGPGTWLLRRSSRNYAANLTLAAAATGLLLSVHSGLVRFYPILGSKPLADAILSEQTRQPLPAGQPADLILFDGELTTGSSLLFYCRQPAHLVNGRINGPWYGSFWPDAPSIFETETTLRRLWASPQRVFFMTSNPASRTRDLAPFAQVHLLTSAGGKTILTNRP